jgi:membrane protein implicated in regulation of membrane protease activity
MGCIRHGRLLLCALLFFVAIYAPLLLGGYATAIAIEMLWNGQESLTVQALLLAVLCGILWVLLVPSWYLARRVHRRRPDDGSRIDAAALRAGVARNLTKPFTERESLSIVRRAQSQPDAHGTD